MSDIKRVVGISISGGGMLGIGPAHFMARLEVLLGKKLSDIGFAFAGTSTGSIIAAGLASGMRSEEIYDLYDKNLKKIFKEFSFFQKLVHKGCASYDNTYLKEILQKYFKGKMNEFKKPIFIPSVIRNRPNQDKIFDSWDKEADKWYAILTSCSAPKYFDSPEKDGLWYADGGLWMNNPIIALGAGVTKKCGLRPDQFRILAFDTGMSRSNSEYTGQKSLVGVADEILDCWVAHSGLGANFIASAYHDVMTLSPTVKKEIKMDDVKRKGEVVEIWDKYFETMGEKVATWLAL